MPIKKTTAAPAAKKPAVAKKEVAQKPAPKSDSYDHSLLEASLSELKREVAILKSELADSINSCKTLSDQNNNLSILIEILSIYSVPAVRNSIKKRIIKK